jgi:hypothetical protein
MEATIPAQSEKAKEWTAKFKEASGFALDILKQAVKKLEKEEDMLIYPFFRLKEDVDKKDFAAIADIAEPFMMAAIRDGFSEEDLDKYFFAYLRNSEKCEVVVGARLKTDKDRANLIEMKKEEDAKKEAEKEK